MPPDPSETPPGLADIDRTLAGLREREEKLLRHRELLLLKDPHQREQRRRLRYSLIGRWCSSRGLSGTDVTELTKFDPDLAWLFGREVLLADGWSEDSANHRLLPPVSDSASRAG